MNNSTNSSSTNVNHGYGFPIVVEQVVWETFLLIVIVSGNITVLCAIKVARQKTRMHFFIKHLACADFLVGILFLSPRIFFQLHEHKYHADDAICKTVEYFAATALFGSNFITVALGIDRLDSVIRPLESTYNWKQPRVMVAVCWILALILAISHAYLYEIENMECSITIFTDHYWRIYLMIIAVIIYIIPTIVLGICYFTIAIKIWRLGKRQTRNEMQMDQDSKGSGHSSKIVLVRQRSTSTSSSNSISNAKMRTIKITLTIVIVFVVCWSPYFIFNLLAVFGHIPKTPEMKSVSIFIQSLAPLISGINPVIYGLFSMTVCKKLRHTVSTRLSLTSRSRRTVQEFP